MDAKVWNKVVTGLAVGSLAALAGVTMLVDPFLHYHRGLSFLQYPLQHERYQNDGIARHYEYDSIITGTSMSQNFKTSEFDRYFNAAAIKIANSGASFRESSENIRNAISHRPEVVNVLCSFDSSRLSYAADENEYDEYPMYLYNDNPFDDVNYLLNKEVIPKTIAVINYTRAGNRTPTMDEYGNWSSFKTFGKEAVLASFQLLDETDEELELTQEEVRRIQENVGVNFLKLAEDHPNVTFYLFFPPYSICYWEALVRTGQLNYALEAQKTAVRVLFPAENVRVYDFSFRTDITGNLDNYSDTIHYGEWINSEILRMISAGEGLLTKDNLEEYYDMVGNLYREYDYSLYKE